MRILYILIIILFTSIFIFSKKNIQENFNTVPKIIWAYWDSNDIPKLVQLCQQNWRKFAPNYDIRFLNKEQAKKIVDLPPFWDNLKPFRQADVFRLKVLQKYGGIWIDASVLLLDNPDNFINHDGLTLFTTPASTNENIVFENWFISSPPGNIIIKKWADELDYALMNYGKYKKSCPKKHLVDVERPFYLICHLVLKNIYERDKKLFEDVKIYDCNETAFYEHKKIGWKYVGIHLFQNFTLNPKRLLIKFRGSDRKLFNTNNLPSELI